MIQAVYSHTLRFNHQSIWTLLDFISNLEFMVIVNGNVHNFMFFVEMQFVYKAETVIVEAQC